MKIMQIIPSLASGGAERIVVDLCNEFVDRVEETYLCITQDPAVSDYGFYLNELSEKVHFKSLNQTKGFHIMNIFRLYKIIRKIKPDIVHLHLGTLLYGYVLSLFFPSIKFFHTIHSLAEKTVANKWLKMTNKFVFQRELIKVIAISDECKQSYSDFYGLNNAYLIYNGRKSVNASALFPEVKNEISQIKGDSGFLFIHIARFHHQKNQQLLIDVFNKLAQDGLDFKLIVLGDWSFCDEAKALKLQACERIYFLGTKTNVQDYLLCADAFCLTSIYEGLPISLLEALSCGCIPICTSVGGIKDVIEDGITGFLAEEADLTSCYSAIKRFVKNGDKIDKHLLVSLFNDRYSIIHTSESHIQLYQSLIKS